MLKLEVHYVKPDRVNTLYSYMVHSYSCITYSVSHKIKYFLIKIYSLLLIFNVNWQATEH